MDLSLADRKNRYCVELSINKGPYIDFGCNLAPDFSNFTEERYGKIEKVHKKTVIKTVKALQKTYCNSVGIKVTIQEPPAAGDSQPGKTVTFDTKDPALVRNGILWKFNNIDYANYTNQSSSDNYDPGKMDDLTTVDLIPPREKDASKYGAIAPFTFRIDSKHMMNFSIENATGCNQKNLLLPM